MSEDWAPHAACRDDERPDDWTVGDRAGNYRALQVCARCPVQAACRAYWGSQPSSQRAGFIAGGVIWNSRGRAPAEPVEQCGSWVGVHRHRRIGEAQCAQCRAFASAMRGVRSRVSA